AGQSCADALLGLARRVDVGGVDEVEPGVERPMDDGDRVVVVAVAHPAEHHGAEAQRADLDTGGAERAVAHGGPLRDDTRTRARCGPSRRDAYHRDPQTPTP